MKLTTILAIVAIATPTGGTPFEPVAQALSSAAAVTASHASLAPAAVRVSAPAASEGPSIEVWTNNEDVLRRGEQVRVFFRASQDAYVTVFRIDTDGRVRVIFPYEPWEDNYARGGQRYETRTYGNRYSFMVDDHPGQGYVFAVASADPFSYNALVRGDHWDYREIAATGRITGDPYVALTDLVDRIVPSNYSEYSYDILPYYVEQRYDYPRFLCYDCHSYASYSYWNPYDRDCFKFRVIVYDDYYYNPVRYGGRARIVYTRTTRIAPRYVFKDRAAVSEPFLTRVRQAPVDPDGRRVLIDPGVRGRDLSGVGQVPSPIDRRASSGAATPQRRPVGNSSESPAAETGRRLVPEQRGDRATTPTVEDSRRTPERTTETTRQVPQLERRGESQREPERPEVREPERKPEPVRREPERREPERVVRPERQREPVTREPAREQPQVREPVRREPAREPAARPVERQPERTPEKPAESKPEEKKSPENAEQGRRRPVEP